MGLSKMLRSASARPTWLDCQRSAVLLPHFRTSAPSKDLEFHFHTSALPWLSKTWCSASALPLCLDCQRSEVPLPLCLYCQRSEVPRPHFRSALTAKYVKFCFRTSALPWLAKIWSSDFRTCSAWTSKDLKFRFCTFAQSWLPKIWRSASPLTLCLHCQLWEVPPPHFPSALTAKDV